jgi:TonB family protein
VVISEVDKEVMESPRVDQADANLDRLLVATDLEEPWYKSLIRGIRETLNPPKLPPLELTSKPIEDDTFGDLNKIEQPWFKSLIGNIRELIHPQKLPPLEVTSKPVEVGSIWGAYGGGETRSGAVSLLIHIGVIALLLLVFQTPQMKKVIKNVTGIYYVPPYQPKIVAQQKAGGGGGGGMKMPQPVSKGEAPKFARKQFIPPMQAVPKPVLPVTPTITAPAPQITAPDYGDPRALSTLFSGGPGQAGFGTGTGGGVGSGNGNGYGPWSGGGTGGGVYGPGGVDVKPQILSQVEPEYSEEARKAKYSGTVLLSIVIDEHGLPRNIHVVRPLGLGLDEKAIEAVQKWRFKPALKNGKPVDMEAQIQVSFRLL